MPKSSRESSTIPSSWRCRAAACPLAVEIAQALHAPLDLVLVRKIGVPFQRELAAAAVVDGGEPEIVVNEDVVDLAGLSKTTSRSKPRSS